MKPIYTIMFFLSLALIVASVVSLAMFGLQLGVDFRGGSVMELQFAGGRPAMSALEGALKNTGLVKDAAVSLAGTNGAIIRANVLSEPDHQKVLAALKQAFPSAGMTESGINVVGPIIGDELKRNSIYAIIAALLAVTLYIAFVFRKLSAVLSPWVMSLATMVALVHDLVIPIGVFALLGHYQGVEIGAVFVAAILTILGYSISDTVVVFDRVRENVIRGLASQEGFGATVHRSIMQTLARSINTNITTLLSLVAIYFFGGESSKYFALALIIGIASGAYSSIFIASPILVWLSRGRRT